MIDTQIDECRKRKKVFEIKGGNPSSELVSTY